MPPNTTAISVRCLRTTALSQIVAMALQPGEDIGTETHHGHDQIFIFAKGYGHAKVDGQEQGVSSGDLLVVPESTEHNITNTGETPLQFCTIYTPPTHCDGTIHATKQDALNDHNDHWEI